MSVSSARVAAEKPSNNKASTASRTCIRFMTIPSPEVASIGSWAVHLRPDTHRSALEHGHAGAGIGVRHRGGHVPLLVLARAGRDGQGAGCSQQLVGVRPFE